MSDPETIYTRKLDGQFQKLQVFLSHSNKAEDYDLANQIIKDLERTDEGIQIIDQSHMTVGGHAVSEITKLVDRVDKTLLVISKNSLDSGWCSFELLISLEKSQRTNQLGVVLLLKDIEETELPVIAVLQEAAKIHYSDDESWIADTITALKDNKTVKDVMPAGNLAHGLVWSHYTGLLQYVLPDLKKNIMESEWFKRQPEAVQRRVSFKLYEMLPSSCTVRFDVAREDPNIEFVHRMGIEYLRAGNHRQAWLCLYKVKDPRNSEEYYCVCEYPTVIKTIKDMEDGISVSSSADDKKLLSADDRKLQRGRFYYTLNSIINHFPECQGKAKVVPYNDAAQTVSEVLIDALKDDIHIDPAVNQQAFVARPLDVENLDVENLDVDVGEFPYEVYVAFTEKDREMGQEIIDYLKSKGVNKILEDGKFLPGQTWSGKMIAAAQQCRWFIFLMTKNAVKDGSLTFHTIKALGDSIYNKRVKVIPVVERHQILCIPELLRWITYIPYDSEGKKHQENLYSIVTGRDIPMETQLMLPAGDVAYGLAWNYVTNYLEKIFPLAIEKIMDAFIDKVPAGTKVRCPKKLFVIIPSSCNTGEHLEKKNERIRTFSATGEVFPFGPGRGYSNTVYKIDNGNANREGLYFAGQYAAPATCLEEMEKFKIGGVNKAAMTSEAKRFYELVSIILEKVDPEKAVCCEIIYFDDERESLANIMEEKILESEPITI